MKIPEVFKSSIEKNNRDMRFILKLVKYWSVFGLGVIVESIAAQWAIGTNDYQPSHMICTLAWVGVLAGLVYIIFLYLDTKIKAKPII